MAWSCMLCLIKHMKKYGGMEIAPHILNLDTKWKWVVSFWRPGRYIPGEKASSPQWIVGWPQHRSERGGEEKKYPFTARTRNQNLVPILTEIRHLHGTH